MASKLVLGRETVWVTLRERPPPTPAATLFAAKRLKPRKRNFDTVGRTGLFVAALKAGDLTEATMMLSSAVKLQFGKVKATGAAEGEREEGGSKAVIGSAAARHLICCVRRRGRNPTRQSTCESLEALVHPRGFGQNRRAVLTQSLFYEGKGLSCNIYINETQPLR